jgi:hypothetical protein
MSAVGLVLPSQSSGEMVVGVDAARDATEHHQPDEYPVAQALRFVALSSASNIQGAQQSGASAGANLHFQLSERLTGDEAAAGHRGLGWV